MAQRRISPRRFFRAGAAALLLGAWTAGATLPGALCASRATAQQAEAPRGKNPRANFWRAVREGVKGTTTVQGQERGVLIQTAGQNWRQIRNGPVAGGAPLVLAAAFLAVGVIYVWKGPDRLAEAPDGELVRRWSLFDRCLHWATAALFVLLALTGFSLFFGRAVLIPVFGLTGFAAYAAVCKVVHNVCGPLFFVGVGLEAAGWIRWNLPEKGDLAWFRNLGGLLGGVHRATGRVNAGQKAWFWVVAGGGLLVGITGLVMDFPLFGQTRLVMQVANIVHSVLATLFLAAALAHVYMGTIGTEGAFQAMWRGVVSGAFARQHYDRWYADVRAARPDVHGR